MTTASVLFFDSLVGYTLAKFRFRGRYLVFIAILSTLMIPTEMLVLPWYSMARNFGWLDTYWGIAFPGLMTGFGTFLMKQFFEDVPDDLLDAARLDGLNEFQVWWQVAMPLVMPALSALAIFTFLGNWTAFLWPLIAITDRNLYTLPVGLASFSGEFQTEWEMVMTGAASPRSRRSSCSCCSSATSFAASLWRASRHESSGRREVPGTGLQGHGPCPLFEGVKRHHWRYQMQINQASAILLAECGLLTDDEASADPRPRSTTSSRRSTSTGSSTPASTRISSSTSKASSIQRLGVDVAGKLHTGRSRNDIDHTVFKLALKDRLTALLDGARAR